MRRTGFDSRCMGRGGIRPRHGSTRPRRRPSHDRPACRPLGLQRRACLPALQCCSQTAPEPGRQRAHVHREWGNLETNSSRPGALSTRMTINDAEVIAEVQALYPEYEQALVTNDVEKLVAMFWDGEQVMRFGATENLY